MWGLRAARRVLVLAGTPVLAMASTASGVSAQPAFEPTFSDSQLCQTVDFGDVRLMAPSSRTTDVVAVSLPAGTLNIPEAISWDGYAGRTNVPAQLSERWELQFFDAAGDVVATSAATPDVADRIERAEWIGSLGSVDLPVPVVGVRANLRNDLPPNETANSVHVSGVTLCFDDPALIPPVCVDGDGNPIPAEADGTCPTAGPAVPQPPAGPTVPQPGVCTDSSGNTVTPNADGSCPLAPIVPGCSDSTGNAVTPNADGTCPASTPTTAPPPAGPTVTPTGGATPVPSQPSASGGQLPVTGGTAGVFLWSGLWLLAAGTTAILYARQQRLT